MLLFFLFDLLKVIPIAQLFIIHVLVQEFVDFVDREGTGNLPKGINIHFEAFQIRIHPRVIIFF